MVDNIADFQIVLTKINRPAVDRRWIARPRLLSALDDALSRKLTLISAPAGYGKTTLAAQWLDHIPHPCAWLSLDEHDDDPDCFLRYVIASIRKIFPQFGPQIEPLLSSPTLPPPEYLADMLISDLAALNQTLVLALDDFHTIASEPVQMMITRLVQYLPDHLHLVIATRVDPPLPLAQWRVRRWLAEIRAADLRFFPEEAHAYFASPFKGRLSDESIERIADRTEGWVTGLQLARLSLADTDNPEALARRFSGSDQIIVEFLMDEVLSRQPAEIKHFFAVTSVLKRFCALLCDHLLGKECGIQDSRRIIALLEKENLFLVPLDTEGLWYRYHHLFQALLVSRMKTDLSQRRQTQIHRRAGEWFADRGQIEDALRHLIIAGDLDSAAELVEQNMHAAIDQDLSRRTLGRWLDMFPEESEKRRPALLVAHAFQKLFRWHLTDMVPLLDQAESLLKDTACSVPETRRQRLFGDIAALRACLYSWQGDPEVGLRHGRLGMRLVPKQHRYAHCMAIMYTAAATAFCGQKDDAHRLLAQAMMDDFSKGSTSAGHLLVTKISILSLAADWDAVEENANLILKIHKNTPQADYWLGIGVYFLGSAAYERNSLDAAAVHFDRVKQMRYRVTTRFYHDALIGLALVALAKGDTNSAERYADAAHSFAIETGDPLSMHISNLIQIRRAMFSGSKPADTALFKPTADSTWIWLIYPSLFHAEYLVNRGGHRDWSAGLDCVEKGLQMARHHHNTRLELQFLAVKAVALNCAGRKNEALELLEKTLRLAQPRGLVRTFVDRGPLMAELLSAMSAKRPGNRYAKSLLEAFGDKVPTEDPAANALEDPALLNRPAAAFVQSGLSNRELEVLTLLQERLRNKEIAERLYISPLTVKTHTANIYRKLKVNTRRQAVARAVQLGLLPSVHA